MTRNDALFDDLMQEAVTACGPIDDDVADLLRAMYSEDNCMEELPKNSDRSNKYVFICFENKRSHGNRLHNYAVWGKGAPTVFELKFRETIVDGFLRNTMFPGVVDDVIVELRNPDWSYYDTEFDLYKELGSKSIGVLPLPAGQNRWSCKDLHFCSWQSKLDTSVLNWKSSDNDQNNLSEERQPKTCHFNFDLQEYQSILIGNHNVCGEEMIAKTDIGLLSMVSRHVED